MQAELTQDKRIRLPENNKAMEEIIIWPNNFTRLNACTFYILNKFLLFFISSDAVTT